MQLVFGDLLKKVPWILKNIKVYFSAMQSMHCGKAQTKFIEKAAELGHTVLTNKKFQQTRFVRSLQRGNTAALRNLPTMVSVIAEEYKEAVLERNATKAKELGKTLKGLRDAEVLFSSIGIGQLLEHYCEASLEVQYASHLPIQSWDRIDKTKEKLKQLGDQWTWSNSNLKMANFGIPDNLISSILLNGEYTPVVPGSISKNDQDCNDSEDENDDSVFYEETVETQQNPKLGGTMPVENANDATLRKVVEKLQLAIKELLKIWDLRQYKTSLQKATMEAFGKIHDSNINEMIELLQSVISNLPTNQSDSFDIQSCYPGFLAWNEFWKQSYSRENVDGKLEALANVHKYYENWIKKSQPEENMPFQELWEVVMIRVGSEAMCETVGSIMVQHGAKNRILQPENFNTEMVLRFNLGPLHHSDGLIAEILAFDATKIYVRKGTRLDKITSQDVNKSSAIATFEKSDKKKSRFPEEFWNSSSK